MVAHGAPVPAGEVVLRRDPIRPSFSWAIVIASLVLFILAVADFIRPDGVTSLDLAGWRPVQEEPPSVWAMEESLEFFRLLPDATDDLGRAVRVDGAVVGRPMSSGFWVRDLRDNIVFVSHSSERAFRNSRRVVRPGGSVRVRGVVSLFPSAEQAEQLRLAGLVVPASAVVIRDVKILSPERGIEVLD